jgi:hypothetical protein
VVGEEGSGSSTERRIAIDQSVVEIQQQQRHDTQ